jgi:predicted PurR-regulated permease PerM
MARGSAAEDEPGGAAGVANERTDPVLENALHRARFWRLFWSLATLSQKGAIWGVFFLLIWLLRDFFPLIFLTFVFSFVAASLVRALGRAVPRLGWKSRVWIVYAGFLLIAGLVVWLLVPDIRAGAVDVRDLVRKFPQRWTEEIEPRLLREHDWYRDLLGYLDAEPQDVDSSSTPPQPARISDGGAPAVAAPPPLGELRLFETAEVRDKVRKLEDWLFERAPGVITGTVAFALGLASLLFLSGLFSFLIVLDLDALTREVKKLEDTKLHEFYRATGSSIVQFGGVLGNVLEAQALISLANTALTALGLKLLFGLPYVAFLALVVFVCGFIPVAGVFISSVPICLVGLQQEDGLVTFVLLVGFITLIHLVEAYILNPRIFGAKLKINPVLVLAILVVGHHTFGVWGLLLGLPCAFYFFKHVIRREPARIGFWGQRGAGAKSGT